jgi:hypothetical protein
MPKRRGTRGRKPSIGIAADKLTEVRRTLRSLGTELQRLQTRLRSLDAYYSRQVSRPSGNGAGSNHTRPNVRDLAYAILKKSRKGLPIQELAGRVVNVRGRRSGAQFAQNLAVALGKDSRFKRIDRGIYAAK